MSNETCGCGTEEKISSAKEIVRTSYEEDFELIVGLLAGDRPHQLGDEDLRINLMVMASRYIVGRTAGICERCSIDGNEIRCFMDAHGLSLEESRARVGVSMPDPNYTGGKGLNMTIAESTVLLIKDDTRFGGAVVKAKIYAIMIDAYDLAKGHDYKGTIDEYYSTFTGIGYSKENIRGTLDETMKAEKLRTNAEVEKVKAETQRRDTEKLRKQTGAEGGNSEKKRISSEKGRSTVFSSMQENIGSKIKEVNTATLDFKNIVGMDKGVFLSINSLKVAYPSPQVGFSAKAGTELPYAIYICEVPGTWKDSGTTYAPTTQAPTVRQTTGESETSAMPQKAVTEKIQTGNGKYLQEVYAKTLAIHDANFDGTRYKGFQTCPASLDASLTAFEKKYIKKVMCLLEDGTWCEMNRMSVGWNMDTDS